MRFRIYYIITLVIMGFFACVAPRKICPAFQSAFIHDKTILENQFSYFGEDSLPKVLEANKDRHLLIEPTTYQRKLKSLRKIDMKDIYPEKVDSLEFDDDVLITELEPRVDSDSLDLDSMIVDSTYVISLKKEKFNIDQELYLWYLREYLVYPDVKLNMSQEDEYGISGRKLGFFRRLFGSSRKEEKDNKTTKTTKFDIETSATELDDKGYLRKNKRKKSKKMKDENNSEEEQNTIPSDDEQENDNEF